PYEGGTNALRRPFEVPVDIRSTRQPGRPLAEVAHVAEHFEDDVLAMVNHAGALDLDRRGQQKADHDQGDDQRQQDSKKFSDHDFSLWVFQGQGSSGRRPSRSSTSSGKSSSHSQS